MNIFLPIVSPDKLSKYFVKFHKERIYEPGRQMINKTFIEMGDQDGNFIKDFQSGGFGGRLLELFLFNFIKEQGITINQEHNRPDFNLEKNGVNFSIEASTSNIAQTEEEFTDSKILKAAKENNLEMQEESLSQYTIKIGSVLFSKLSKKYWELDWVKGKPLIIAVTANHHSLASFLPHSKMFEYLYKTKIKRSINKDGNLVAEYSSITEHKLKDKTIPSGYFNQPDSENISAVIFINTSDFSKFNRMGFEKKLAHEDIKIMHSGLAFDSTPGAQAKSFTYTLGEREPLELWSEGVTIFHNPNALYPLDVNVFTNVEQTWVNKEGNIVGTDMPKFQPLTSRTFTFDMKAFKEKHPDIKDEDIDAAHSLSIVWEELKKRKKGSYNPLHDDSLWRYVQQRKSSLTYKDYLNKYPNGKHSKEARKYLD